MNPTSSHLLLALGANVRGRCGAPLETLRWAIKELARVGLFSVRVSSAWSCAPFGRLAQPRFVNAVVLTRSTLPPREILSILRLLENRAGRRRGRVWGPRALDIDVLDHGGRPLRPVGMGGRAKGAAAHAWQRKGLVLPHPGMPERPFVLLPLAEIWPEWRHPVLGRSARQLLHDLPPRRRRSCHRLPEANLTAE